MAAGLNRRELIGLAALLSLGAIVLGRRLGAPSLEFDEGVYLLSADLLARGFELGGEVFTSQPPLFLGLLGAANELLGGSLAGLRALAVAVALAGALAGWAIVRGIAGPAPALAAVALVVLAPGVVDAAAVVSADVPCVALGTGALLAARAARRRPAWAALAGALLACALLVKLLAAPFAVALAVGAFVDRPPRRALAWFVAGALGVLAGVAIAYASVIGELWQGAVGLHLEAREGARIPGPSIAVEAALISSAYAGLLAILAYGLRDAGRRERVVELARPRVDLIATLAAGIVLVAVHRPLLHHHLVIVAWPLALLAASTISFRPSPRALAAVAAGTLLVVPWAVRGRDTVEGAERQRVEAVASVVRDSTAPGEPVVSDLPLVPLLAGRPAAAETVDPSFVRVSTRLLWGPQILAASREAAATVVGRSFALVPGLERRLARRASRVAEVAGVRIYIRDS